MTFFPEFGVVFHWRVGSLPIRRIHNDSMYVRFGGIRNTKIWSKSSPYRVFCCFFSERSDLSRQIQKLQNSQCGGRVRGYQKVSLCIGNK